VVEHGTAVYRNFIVAIEEAHTYKQQDTHARVAWLNASLEVKIHRNRNTRCRRPRYDDACDFKA
jgi:hypothetical protein